MRDSLSGLENFEGLDPAEWCQRGYAIVNIDARGSYYSDGDLFIHGNQVHTAYSVESNWANSISRRAKTARILWNGLPPKIGLMEASEWRAIHGLQLFNGDDMISPIVQWNCADTCTGLQQHRNLLT